MRLFVSWLSRRTADVGHFLVTHFVKPRGPRVRGYTQGEYTQILDDNQKPVGHRKESGWRANAFRARICTNLHVDAVFVEERREEGRALGTLRVAERLSLAALATVRVDWSMP